mmetsp:Transcript_21651/g.47084  ORF Transcript_21651/g.47084 Transcript_21651/m.47084 type:complete len:147 (-) Transcript_21651:180-620(-)
MSPRIVDSSSLAQRPPRSVLFSQTSYLVLYEEEEGKRSSWTTGRDEIHFKRDVIQDAQEAGKILADKSPGNVPREDVLRCIGIEHLVLIDKASHVMEFARNHVQLVIDAQDRCSEKELGRISRRSSRRSRKRSQTLAAGYWAMTDD